MARLNTASPRNRPQTHEGAPAWQHLSPMQSLRRSVLSCLLWEGEFYEDGESIATRIMNYAQLVPAKALAELAIEARSKFNLRHVPLLLLTALARTGKGSRLVQDTIAATIQRADELGEFLAIYAKANGVPATWTQRGKDNGLKKKLSAQVKRGLARAFNNFDAYQLAKYDRDSDIKLRDVAFMVHAKPRDPEKAALLAKLVNRTFVPKSTKSSGFALEILGVEKPGLESPDTWEVALSGGADKRETFTRLLQEGKLGYLALLRNLRNMTDAGVDRPLIEAALLARKGANRVLPFRYVAAARACPMLEPVIDKALVASVREAEPLPGLTAVLVDVSGSMDRKLSDKSDLTRIDAAAVLASVINGDRRVFTFSDRMVEVPPRTGMAGVDVIAKSQRHNGTNLGEAVAALNQLDADRLIVITDEQSHTVVPSPAHKRSYMINVASYEHGVGYGPWVHIDGFSEQVLRFIREYESGKTED